MLARYGASEPQQSIAVVVRAVSAFEKFSGQFPEMLE